MTSCPRSPNAQGSGSLPPVPCKRTRRVELAHGTRHERLRLVKKLPLAVSTSLQTLRRASQRALIITHKFLDTLSCEFMCDVKAFPGKVEIQPFVWDRLQSPATRIDPSVREISVVAHSSKTFPGTVTSSAPR